MIDRGLLFLAIEDFIPVFLSAAGLWVIARLCGAQDKQASKWSFAGLAFIFTGGLTKPIYKTLLALSDGSVDIVVLDTMLFWFLAPGFLLVGAGVKRAVEVEEKASPKSSRWVPLTAVAIVSLATVLLIGGSRAWFFLLLSATTAANIWTVVILVRWSRIRQNPLASGLFAASLLVALGLAGVAAALEQTIPVQWGEQLASTAGQAMFLLGAVRLAHSSRE